MRASGWKRIAFSIIVVSRQKKHCRKRIAQGMMFGARVCDGLRCLRWALSPLRRTYGTHAPPRALRAPGIPSHDYSSMQAGWRGGWVKGGWSPRWAAQRGGASVERLLQLARHMRWLRDSVWVVLRAREDLC